MDLSRIKCVKCKAEIDGFVVKRSAQPRLGDVVVCFSCGAVMIFTENNMRLISEDETGKIVGLIAVAYFFDRLRNEASARNN